MFRITGVCSLPCRSPFTSSLLAHSAAENGAADKFARAVGEPHACKSVEIVREEPTGRAHLLHAGLLPAVSIARFQTRPSATGRPGSRVRQMGASDRRPKRSLSAALPGVAE